MVSSFLDKAGLTYLWGKITALVSGKQDVLTFDSTPTANSTNPVTSAGIKAYVDENAGGDVPVENGTGAGSVQSKAYVIDSTTYTQNASGDGATAIGENTIAKGEASSARGINTLASGKGSSAEGYGNVVTINVTCDAGSANATYTELSTAFPSGVSTAYILDPSDATLYYVASINSNTHTFRMVPAPESAMSNKTMVVMVHCASGQASHTEGCQTWAAGNYSHAEGYDTKADSDAVHAEGFQTKASGIHSHVEGRGCTASSEVQHVQGKYNIVDSSGTYAHIVGNGTGNGTGRSNAHTLDWSGNAWYAGKVSAGTVANPAPVTNANDLATKAYVDTQVGYKMSQPDGWGEGEFLTLNSVTGQPEWAAPAGGDAPVESGTGVGSVQTKEFLDGNTTRTQVAYGVGSMAEGAGTYAVGKYSHAEGKLSIANTTSAHAEGDETLADGVASHAEGSSSIAIGSYSHSEGTETYAKGDSAHAEGRRTYANTYAHSEGQGTSVNLTLTSYDSTATAVYTCASIPRTVKRGMNVYNENYPNAPRFVTITQIDRTNNLITLQNTIGTLSSATVPVYTSSAYGQGSHVEGAGCAAYGSAAHAEGSSTSADGNNSHAEGYLCEANNAQAHAEGHGTIASAAAQHVEGKFNIADTTSAHIVGNGSNNNNRSNAYTLDWNGNAWFAGSITLHDSTGDVTITAAQLRSLLALI